MRKMLKIVTQIKTYQRKSKIRVILILSHVRVNLNCRANRDFSFSKSNSFKT